MTQTFDPARPVQTRDGRKARIICTDRNSPVGLSVAALVEFNGEEELLAFFSDGNAFDSLPCDNRDLINTPTIPKGLRGLEDVLGPKTLQGVVKRFKEKGLVVVPRDLTPAMDRAMNGAGAENDDQWTAAISAWEKEK